MSYTADGEKLSKTVGGVTKNYVSGIEYNGAALESIYHSEGRCTLITSTFRYEYNLKDHLGNTRVRFQADGSNVSFQEESHYYPFGLLMEGNSTAPASSNAYKYNGKELNTDLGLNLSDYGARWYDAALGRWWSVDPMGEGYASTSGYNYVLNNPLIFVDPDGMQVRNTWYDPFLSSVEDNNQAAESGRAAERASLDEVGRTAVRAIGSLLGPDNGTDWFYHAQTGELRWFDYGFSNSFLGTSPGVEWHPTLESDRSYAGYIKAQYWRDLYFLYRPRYDKVVPDGNGGNWLSRSTLATQSINYSRDNSALYRFSDEFPGYLGTSVSMLFGAGEVVDFGFSAYYGIRAYFAAQWGSSWLQGGKTFAQYKASRGGTETLAKISTSTGTQRISTEFHHVFLTQRMQRAYNLPNWAVNNRINVWKLNTVQHSLIDSYRYNFLRAGFKSDVGWFGKYNWFTKF